MNGSSVHGRKSIYLSRPLESLFPSREEMLMTHKAKQLKTRFELAYFQRALNLPWKIKWTRRPIDHCLPMSNNKFAVGLRFSIYVLKSEAYSRWSASRAMVTFAERHDDIKKCYFQFNGILCRQEDVFVSVAIQRTHIHTFARVDIKTFSHHTCLFAQIEISLVI